VSHRHRSFATCALLALAGCAHAPQVERAAFEPLPRRIAVIDFDSDLIRGMIPPRPVPEVNAPYQYFRQRISAWPLFQLLDDARVASDAVYRSLPTRSRNVEVVAGNMRAVELDAASAARLAHALGVDLLLRLHFSPEVEEAFALNAKVVSTANVEVDTELEAWDAQGSRVWRDDFSTDSSKFRTVLGFHSEDVAKDGAAEAIAHASQEALDRLYARLSEGK
jgi:hypothetical protein